MSVRIRLARGGSKKRPFHKIVVADSRSPRDGRFIEQLGYYNPLVPKDHPEHLKVDSEKVKTWLAKGALPSDRLTRLFASLGLVSNPVIKTNEQQPKKSAPKAKAQERLKEQAEREAAKKEAEEQAKREAEEQAKREAEEQAKREAEEQAKREAEEQAKQEAEEQAKREAEEQAKKEAEEQAKKEAEEQAKKEAEKASQQNQEVPASEASSQKQAPAETSPEA